MRHHRWLPAGVGAALLLIAVVWTGARRTSRPHDALAGAHANADARIRVEVLNATRTRGLARRGMLHLRDRGFDVVSIGTESDQRDSTLVIDRVGRPEWARLVAEALGGAAVTSRIDSSRYLDVTVLLGTSWTPPAEPFRP